nr:T9SS type A sorting domain-containing protein [Tenacibaculum mesophilum]
MPQYDSSQNYQVGDRVVYFNVLYERTSSGWNNIGSCGNSKNTDLNTERVLVNDKDIIVFSPNPIEDSFMALQVNNELWKNREVAIYNANGRLLTKVKMSSRNSNIDVSKLSAGIYFVSLDDTGKRYTKQLVKK